MHFGLWPRSSKSRWLWRAAAFAVPAMFLAGMWLQTPAAGGFAQLRNSYQASDAWVVDRHGHPMESMRTHKDRRSLEWIPWDQVSPAFQELLVRTEDQRFFAHFGVDPLAALNAGLQSVKGGERRGASTLTMQVAGLLTKEKSTRRNLTQKIRQMLQALKLDAAWSKHEILEAYVNLVPFRGELVGLRAASLGYFRKNPAGLLVDEAALLIALIRAPNAKAALVGKRACHMLKAANCQPLLNLAEKTFSKSYLIARSREVIPVMSPHFVQKGWGTSLLESSLDLPTQKLALSLLREQLRALQRQNVNDGAVLVLETKTGKVVAYAANGGPGLTSAPQVDGIQTRRQAGSTIKAFVYAQAYEMNVLAPDSLLDDSPADISISQGRVYHPRNYDHTFRGTVSAGEALGSSMNVPAVKTLNLVGESQVLDKLRQLGFQDLEEDDYYGPSLALGAIDVTLWELTQGYRQLATESPAFSAQTRLQIFNSLGAPEYRRFTFGMDSLLTLPFPAAVKTGTSKDMRDNWCIGWTPEFTVGVWVGNFNGEPMWNVSGMSGAAPVWRQMMLALHPLPQTTTPAKYQPRALELPQKTLSRIRYPAAGMLVGFDPDIPKKRQKLAIEIENPQKNHLLFLNRKLVGRATSSHLWPITRGHYRLKLQNDEGQSIDEVFFEVR